MPSPINSLRCLIVEDDEHKAAGVSAHLHEVLGLNITIVICGALSTAIAELQEGSFHVAVIDMSIPSHPPMQGAGTAYSFPTGGLDVVFEIDYLQHKTICIILTQYTDIEIEGALVPLEQSAAEIHSKFGIAVAGCVKYDQIDQSWKEKLRSILQYNENLTTRG